MKTLIRRQLDCPLDPDPDPDSERDPEQRSPSATLPQPQHSIAAVSRLSGISCHTLRV